MVRAGVFIGIDRSGQLPLLNDAAAGAGRMRDWAKTQGVSGVTNCKLITDANGQRVSPDDVYEAIANIVNGPGVDQLIIYFAGHGVNINRGEQWLLSDAPVRTSAAIDVTGSVELARYCGIQHVVIISDACRVAPEGIQAQNVRGVDVFPNDGAGDRAKPVDQFLACMLGRTAAELQDPNLAAANYSALYTSALLDALSGVRPDVLDPADEPDDLALFLRMRRLERYLETEIPQRVKARGLERRVNQNPDAIITSENGWLARFEMPATRRGPMSPTPPGPVHTTLSRLARDLTHVAVTGGSVVTDALKPARSATVEGSDELAESVELLSKPFGPDRFETECGIKVRGAHIIAAFSRFASLEQVSDESLRVQLPGVPAASTVLEVRGGFGTVIPVIQGYIAALTFEDRQLVDISYEPSANSWRWPMFQDYSEEVRALRAVASSASQRGRFQLDGDDVQQIARRMQYAKRIDPTLSVYAAYAYHDLQEIDRIRDMAGFLHNDVGCRLFDLQLLGRLLVDKAIDPALFIVPFVPLLSQGWSLVRANRVKLHPALRGLDETMLDSLWSLYTRPGLDQLRECVSGGEVR